MDVPQLDQTEPEIVSLILDSLPALIAYVDTNLTYRHVNRSYAEFFDKSRDEIIGRTVQQILPPEFLTTITPRIETVLSGDRVSFEVNIVRPIDDKPYRLNATLMPRFNDWGKVDGFFVLALIMSSGIYDSHYEDLERFMCHWQDNPPELAEFVGKVMGRIGYRHMPQFTKSLSSSYFACRRLPDKIDYLYDNTNKQPTEKAAAMMKKSLTIDEKDGVVCLHDISGRHNGIRVMLLRDVVDDVPYYSLRYFVVVGKESCVGSFLLSHWSSTDHPDFEHVLQRLDSDNPKYEIDLGFWNFRRPLDPIHGVIIYPECDGFYDFDESKSVADLIILAANLLGHR